MPQIQVWINNDDDKNVEKLVKTLNEAVLANKAKNLKAFFIFVTDKGKSFEPKLLKVEAATGAHDLALAYVPPKHDGVAAYKVNLDSGVKNTVMLYRKRKVTAKFVNLAADEKGLKELSAAVTELTK